MKRLQLIDPSNLEEHEARAALRMREIDHQVSLQRQMVISFDPEKTIMSWNHFHWMIAMAWYSGLNYRDHEIARGKK